MVFVQTGPLENAEVFFGPPMTRFPFYISYDSFFPRFYFISLFWEFKRALLLLMLLADDDFDERELRIICSLNWFSNFLMNPIFEKSETSELEESRSD